MLKNHLRHTWRDFINEGLAAAAALFIGPSVFQHANAKSKNVVIIGSGITGLCSAAILAKQGYAVTVLEANPQFIGGHARSYVLEKCEFCAGPQYVWNFGDGEIGKKVLEYLGLEDAVRFVRMDRLAFANYIIGNAKPIPIPMGLDNYLATAIKQYSASEKGLRLFFSIIHDLYEGSKLLERKGLYLSNEFAMKWHVVSDLSMPLHCKLRMFKFSAYSLADVLDYCGLDGEVCSFLYGHGGMFAESQNEVSAILYAAGTGSYYSDAFVPEQGFKSFVNALCATINLYNGQIICDKTAAEIVTNGRNVVGVSCKDGSHYQGDIVISNVSPRLTCRMLQKCHPDQYSYAPSNSLVACYLVLRNAEQIRQALPFRNYWWQEGKNEVDYAQPDMLQPPQMLFVGSPSSNTYNVNMEVTDLPLVIFAPGNFGQAKRMAEMGDEAYQKMKDTMAENIICILNEKVFPGIREKLVHQYLETPLDTYLQTGAENGNAYGRRLTAKSVLSNLQESIGNIKNLYVGCATIGLPGVATCFRTASILCKKISGIDVVI